MHLIGSEHQSRNKKLGKTRRSEDRVVLLVGCELPAAFRESSAVAIEKSSHLVVRLLFAVHTCSSSLAKARQRTTVACSTHKRRHLLCRWLFEDASVETGL